MINGLHSNMSSAPEHYRWIGSQYDIPDGWQILNIAPNSQVDRNDIECVACGHAITWMERGEGACHECGHLHGIYPTGYYVDGTDDKVVVVMAETEAE